MNTPPTPSSSNRREGPPADRFSILRPPSPPIRRARHRTVLPGFGISAAITSLMIVALVVIPLAVLILRAASLGPAGFLAAAWTPRARAASAVSLGSSLTAAVISSLLGLLVAWVLVRLEFPGRRILDALVDVPLALPTAVAGLVYSTLYVEKGWLGQWLVPMGIKGAYSLLGIVLVLVFVSLPFAIRVVQPVIESLDKDTEEPAQARAARVYLRPHELDIARTLSGGPSEAHQATSLPATVLRQTRTGPITRITCQPQEGGSELHVDLPSAAARQLGLQSGGAVSITPRHVRVFLPDPEYVI